MRYKETLNRVVFFIGWALSPLTFWNDSFVNIPISYLLANICVRIFPANFLLLVLIFYWLSNGLGVLMMYASGKRLIEGKGGIVRSLAAILTTIAAYSLILILLGWAGVLKPF